MDIKDKKEVNDQMKKRSQLIQYHDNDELRQVFIGHHTIFSVMGFTVGGILIGGTLQEVLHDLVGLPLTLIIGIVMLLVSGLVLNRFND